MRGEEVKTLVAYTKTRPDPIPGAPAKPGPATRDDWLLPKLAPGSVIPETRLSIVRWLGQGGMGVVFEVRHLDIERRYAVKLLSLSQSFRSMRRFREEARTISQIGSPWIVEIFDFKELSDGRLMYLMELVDGVSLCAIGRDEGPLALPRLLGLARQICKGLHDAHEAGFVHRDVKPENVMVSTDARGREQVKLVDFGLAALAEGPRHGNNGGTPAYMSPEQCQGITADERADIYSLCVTLYELASGHLPFQTTDVDAMRTSHVITPPRPPSELVEGGLPSGLDKIILRGMSKDPELRYPSAAELEAALIELQLELGLRTAWDELPAPILTDEKRTQRLEEGLATMRGFERIAARRRTIVGVALLALFGVALALGWRNHLRAEAETVAEVQREIEGLSERAREAAAHARWVYPTVADPEAETAYRVVLELESLQLVGVEQTGATLRDEFADTLLGLGDNYWDREGGREFAWEFYVQALMFGDHERVKQRVALSEASLLKLRERAAVGEFEPHELVATEPLVALAEGDEKLRYEKLAAVKRARRQQGRTSAEVDRLFDTLGAELPDELVREVAATLGPRAVAEPPELPVDAFDVEVSEATDGELADAELAADVELGDGEPGAGQLNDAGPSHSSGPSRKHKSSNKAAVEAAQAAYEAGRNDEAERLFRQVLARNSRNVAALVGLHHIYFDRSDYRQALEFARRAVRLRPKRKDLHMFVGDSCTKIMDYGCARKHYQKAKGLGHSQAGQRLSLLEKRVGSK
ncbi:Serine/threonine-protein kinase PknB [Enhygromyxa salina]|uniref:Serine/threonine-protein kinase PknB n=1 Tax=Enhygromyxa salina TaxID=215803 RepID=A0A2S9XEZ6_9BACT|nr:serine/threonine-protein kinase [Enhygromyxa salina]PRP91443.1 Serine/threonine-protein kinase PknB [Enhygromyxa salina]